MSPNRGNSSLSSRERIWHSLDISGKVCGSRFAARSRPSCVCMVCMFGCQELVNQRRLTVYPRGAEASMCPMAGVNTAVGSPYGLVPETVDSSPGDPVEGPNGTIYAGQHPTTRRRNNLVTLCIALAHIASVRCDGENRFASLLYFYRKDACTRDEAIIPPHIWNIQ